MMETDDKIHSSSVSINKPYLRPHLVQTRIWQMLRWRIVERSHFLCWCWHCRFRWPQPHCVSRYSLLHGLCWLLDCEDQPIGVSFELKYDWCTVVIIVSYLAVQVTSCIHSLNRKVLKEFSIMTTCTGENSSNDHKPFKLEAKKHANIDYCVNKTSSLSSFMEDVCKMSQASFRRNAPPHQWPYLV